MVSNYNYFKQLLQLIKRGAKLPIARINLIGSRMSGKTYSAIDFFIMACLIAPVKVDAFRYFKGKDRQELFEQFIKQCSSWYLDDVILIHRTNMTITFPNGSIIEVNGLHSPTQKGEVKMTGKSASFKFNYAFAFAEERYEINNKEWSDVLQAIRGTENFMEVHAANPWILTNDYVSYVNENLPFDLDKLIANGEQYKVIDKKQQLIDGTTFEYKEIFHITNYKINNYLPVIDKVKLELAAKSDPHRANTILYGFYGTPEGSIWKWVLPKIIAKPKYKSMSFVGGVDYGEKNDPTTAYIVGFSNNYEEAHIKHEYYWRNGGGRPHKNTNDLAADVVEHYLEFMDANDLQGDLSVYVDGAAIPFITALNTYAEDLGYDHIIHFYQQNDKKKVADRVETMKTLASFDIIKVDNECKELLRELNEQTYADKTRSSVDYINGDDHGTDAMYYGLATQWVALMENMDYVLEKQAREKLAEENKRSA